MTDERCKTCGQPEDAADHVVWLPFDEKPNGHPFTPLQEGGVAWWVRRPPDESDTGYMQRLRVRGRATYAENRRLQSALDEAQAEIQRLRLELALGAPPEYTISNGGDAALTKGEQAE